MEQKLEISAEVTPNPNTLKFNLNRTLLPGGSLNYTDKAKAKGARLPEMLFAVENVLGVMVGSNFITVTKRPESDWAALVAPVTERIKEILAIDAPLFPEDAAMIAASSGGAGTGDIETKIKQILDSEIRPAVAMDGGDITFYGYRDGVVTLHLQGSCSSCPSSIMTLKMGVENRLKASIPEVREVVQI